MQSDLRRMLDGGSNPVLDGPDRITYFAVYRSGVPVGRVTAHIHDDSNRVHGLRRGYFGFFDCAEDAEAARLLADAAAAWLRARGCDEMVGSVNLTAMQQMGVVTAGFENAPYIDQAYNAPHIPELLEGLGFERTFPMSTFELDLTAVGGSTLTSLASGELAAHDDVRCLPVRRRGLGTMMESCRELLNASFAQNPLFVPLRREAFQAQARELTWIMDERLSSVWTLDGAPAGVLVCIPDLNAFLRATRSRLQATTPIHFVRHRLRRRRALLVFSGVLPTAQGRGLAGLMFRRTIDQLVRAGYTSLGITWIADDNAPSLRQMEKVGARRLHRLHLYRSAL
jgi:GNAT superfamily N-acetyltransferase